MAIVENQNGKFYIPDEIANDPTKTVAEIQENAIPWDEYVREQQREVIQQQLDELGMPTDEELLAWAKENHPIMQERRELEEQLNNLG